MLFPGSLARLGPSIHSYRQRLRPRCLSSLPDYSDKVTAFPFAFSEYEAIHRMAPYASMACMFQGILSSIGARLFPGMFTPLYPKTITPVYFPAWFVDAEVSGDILAQKEDGSEKRPSTLISSFSYMPGISYNIVSRLSLNVLDPKGPFPVPFTPDMANQHGSEVSCLPFTTTPLAVMDSLPTLSYSDARIGDKLRFLPATVKPRLIAAYPVLLPLYLARYEFTAFDRPMSTTLMCEAYTTGGRTFSDSVIPDIVEELESKGTRVSNQIMSLFGNISDETGIIIYDGSEREPNFLQARLLTPFHNKHWTAELARWVDGLIRAPGGNGFVNNDQLSDLSDPRVRQLSQQESETNLKWILLTAEIEESQAILSALNTGEDEGPKPKVMVFEIGQKTEGGVTERLKARVQALQETKRDTEPQWWKEWRERKDAASARTESSQ